MKLSCAKKCRIVEFFANFKCPNCFTVETYSGEGDTCDCRLKGGSRLRFVAD
jgi:hypothetical protein